MFLYSPFYNFVICSHVENGVMLYKHYCSLEVIRVFFCPLVFLFMSCICQECVCRCLVILLLVVFRWVSKLWTFLSSWVTKCCQLSFGPWLFRHLTFLEHGCQRQWSRKWLRLASITQLGVVLCDGEMWGKSSVWVKLKKYKLT